MPATTLQQRYLACYQRFSALQKRYRQADADIESTNSMELATLFLQLAKQEPDVFSAQLSLSLQSLPYVHRLTLTTATLTTLLCMQQNWHDSSTVEQIAATLMLHSHRQSAVEKWALKKSLSEQDKSQLKQSNHLFMQEFEQHPMWPPILQLSWEKLSTLSALKYLDKANTQQRIAQISSLLALLITKQPNRNPMQFSDALTKLARILPSNCWIFLEQLLKYPGKIPAGSLITLNDNSEWRTLSNQEGSVLCSSCAINSQSPNIITNIKTEDIKSIVGQQFFKDLHELDQYWNIEWQKLRKQPRIQALHFRIDIAPPTLTDIQQQLTQEQVDVNALCRLINSEQVLATHIQQHASQKSRLQLDISNVKHALMMNGLNRTLSVLRQQALTLRLTQYQFPLLATLVQFTEFASHVAAQLSRSSQLPILPEEASCLVWFSHAGLFTSNEIKKHKTLQSRPTLNIGNLPRHPNKQLREHANKLASYWQLEEYQIKAMRLSGNLGKQKNTCSKYTRQIAAILGLSLLLAEEQYFCSGIPRDNNTIDEFNLAVQLLGLDNQKLSQIFQNSIAQAHCYSAL